MVSWTIKQLSLLIYKAKKANQAICRPFSELINHFGPKFMLSYARGVTNVLTGTLWQVLCLGQDFWVINFDNEKIFDREQKLEFDVTFLSERMIWQDFVIRSKTIELGENNR